MVNNSTAPFKNRHELVSYADQFVKNRIKVFRKDLSICLKADANGRHAYMPALMTCISLLELFSGLYIGNLRSIGLSGIIKYAEKFMDSKVYSSDRLTVLYHMFRHKIAHLGRPYGIFDTDTVSAQNRKYLKKGPRRLISWRVNATNRLLPIEIIPENGAPKESPPWPVIFSHRCIVSIYRLKVDIVSSAGSYLEYVKKDIKAQDKFCKCIKEFFPQ
jgi:hypothetical protein